MYHVVEQLDSGSKRHAIQYNHVLNENSLVVGLANGNIIHYAIGNSGKTERELSETLLFQRLLSGLTARTMTESGILSLKSIERAGAIYVLALCSDLKIRVWEMASGKSVRVLDLVEQEGIITADSLTCTYSTVHHHLCKPCCRYSFSFGLTCS